MRFLWGLLLSAAHAQEEWAAHKQHTAVHVYWISRPTQHQDTGCCRSADCFCVCVFCLGHFL